MKHNRRDAFSGIAEFAREVLRLVAVWSSACPMCRRAGMHRTHRRDWERIFGILLAYRCDSCGARFLKLRWRVPPRDAAAKAAGTGRGAS